ncbi:VOC family protein [Paenibacillus radicis (ex Gao et al. 2016)]|uniref:VOC family protein n=1 Tax=Paenibacillus radicis (ex Gao et al. 2016) TaxID=1737354 RepID=A0A917H1E4_9BACL|nr:VOC family protein [Paenibacillus radicis (ex Gao et al. 2016)]GGG64446.1 VOC family protein [Paenibacillus radicis (ex Gao et al. 2016)]
MGAQLTPYILSEDARVQAAFYKEALGGEVLSVATHGQIPGTPEAIKEKVMHLSMTAAGNNSIFMSDAFGPVSFTGSLNLSLTYDNEPEARTAYTNLGEGGSFKYPFELQPWGAYYGEVVDKFGVTWQIVKQ